MIDSNPEVGLSRRGFLKGSALAGTFALGGSAFLAACGSDSNGAASPGTSSGPQPAGVPKKGGTLNIGVTKGYAFDTLDPAKGTSGSDYLYLFLIFARLIERDPKTSAYVPGLATSWQFSGADKLEFDLQLRRGVTFQDGTPVDAKAVKFSLDRFKKESSVPQLQYVKSVQTTGEYSIKMRFTRPQSQMPFALSDRAGLIVSPAAVQKYGKGFGTHPVGAGPFSFVSQVAGSSAKLKRFLGYYEASKIHLDSINWHIYGGDTPLVAALRSGVIDFAHFVGSQDVEQLRKDSKYTVDLGPVPGGNIIYFNTGLAPLNDRNVRLAIEYALDRKAIADAATVGLGKPLYQPIPDGSPGHVDVAPLWPHNPDKARELLRSSGHNGAVKLSAYTYPGFGYDITAPIIISNLKKVGIDLSVKTGTVAQVSDFYANKLSQAYLSVWPGSGNPPSDYNGLLSDDSYYNSGHNSFGMQKLIDDLDSTYSGADRQAIYTKIIKTVQQQAPYAPLYTFPAPMVYDNKLGGFAASPLGPNQEFVGHMYYKK